MKSIRPGIFYVSILIVLLPAIACSQKSQREILDETGGLELVFGIDMDKSADLKEGQNRKGLEKMAIQQAVATIGKRLNLTKVNHYIHILPPGDRFRIRLRPENDKQKKQINSLIRAVGKMELLPVTGDTFQTREEALANLNGTLPEGEKILSFIPAAGNKGYSIVSKSPVITNNDIAKSKLTKDNYGADSITITLDDAGAKKLEKYSTWNIGEKVALVMDERIIMAPTIQSALSHTFVITGRFISFYAGELLPILKSGVLPAPLKAISEDVFYPKGKKE